MSLKGIYCTYIHIPVYKYFNTLKQMRSLRNFVCYSILTFENKTENKGIRFRATVVNSTKFSILFPSVLFPLCSLPPSPSCCQQVHAVSRAPYLLTTFTFMIPIGNGIQLVWITTLGHDWSPPLLSHTVHEWKAFYQEGGDTVK